MTVVFLVILNRQRHPALIVAHRRSVDRVKPERAAESFLGLIQFGRTPPYFDRTLVKICNQPFGVADVRPRGYFLQQVAQPYLVNLYLRSRMIHQPFLSVRECLIGGRQKTPALINTNHIAGAWPFISIGGGVEFSDSKTLEDWDNRISKVGKCSERKRGVCLQYTRKTFVELE
jgi:hypothetical protein